MPGSAGPATPSAARRFVARLGGVLRVDAQRPAAWLAAATAVISPTIATAGPLLPAAAIVVGGCSAVAAIGAPPRLDGLGTRPVSVWWTARAAWPALGILLAAVGCGRPIIATVGTAAVLAAAVLSYTAASMGASAALAASTALVPVLAAAAGCVAGGGAGAVIAGGLAAGLVLVVGRRGTIADAEEGPAAVDAEPIASRTPLLALSLVSSLAAMAGCYFLDPRQAAWYAALAAAWMVGLAVPEATLGAGGADGSGRRRLVRGGPLGAPAALALWRSSLGDGRRGGLLVARQAALLGWPAVVAAVLWGGTAARTGGPLAAVVVLVVVAALIAVVAGGLAAAHAAAETALAATLLAAVFAMLAMMRQLPEPPRPSTPASSVATVVPAAVLSGREIPARLPSRRSCLSRTPGGGPIRDAAPMKSRNGVASNDIRVRSVPVTRIPHPRRGVLSCE